MGNWGYNRSKGKFGIVENLILKRKVALSEKTFRDGAPAGIVDTYVKVKTKLMAANIFVPHFSLPCYRFVTAELAEELFFRARAHLYDPGSS